MVYWPSKAFTCAGVDSTKVTGVTVLRRAANESPAERSQASSFIHARSKQASYKSGSCCYLCIALRSGGILLWVQEELSVCLLLIGTICLPPVDKLISDDDLFLFLIHSSDLQEVFCLAMLIIA